MAPYRHLSKTKSLVYIILISGLVLIFGSGIGGYATLDRVSSRYKEMQQNQVKLSSIQRLLYLDQALIQSAKNYVYFNDEIYKARYDSLNQLFGSLQTDMAELEWSEAVAPNFEITKDSIAGHDTSEAFVEKMAFDLLIAGKQDSALSLIASGEYNLYKKRFLSKIEEIRNNEQLDKEARQRELESSLDQLKYSFFAEVLLVLVFFVFLGALWFMISKIFKNNKTLYDDLEGSVAREHKSIRFQATLLADLEEYADLTSHQLRAPLARMQGVMGLISLEKEDGVHLSTLLGLLNATSTEMDEITREMNHILTRNSYDELRLAINR